MDKRFLIANWKMHPVGVKKAKEIFSGAKEKASRSKNVELVVCPPYVFIPPLQEEYSGKKIKFGAQDCFYEERVGSYTGEVSPGMLAENGVAYVIIGHSERRELWEDDKTVNSKVRAAINQGLKVVVCIGERQRDPDGAYFSSLRKELEESLRGLHRSELHRVLIAYEPLWAIGKTEKEAIDPEELHTMKIFIRKVLSENYDKNVALKVAVLYGGSVNSANIEELLKGDVDGFLVGRAGRKPEEIKVMLEVLNKK